MAVGQKNRLATYRRRLALAAVASVALHLLLAKGLAITHLGFDAAPDAAPAKPLKPKRQADFPLAVPRSPATEPLAHERPLDVKISPPEQPRRRPEPQRPDRTVAERKADEPAERVAAAQPQASRVARDRDTALAAAAAAARRAEVAAAQPPTAAADLAAIGAAAVAAEAKAPAPAAAPAVPRAAPAPIASRWRPREVALLERLTAPQPAAVSRPAGDGDGEPAARSSAAASRAAVTSAAASSTDAMAAAIESPAAAATGPAAPVAPAARPRPQSTGQAGATTARAATGDDASPTAAASARTSVAVTGNRDSRAITADDTAIPANGSAPGRQQARAGAANGAAATIDLPAATAGGSQAAGGGARPATAGRPTADVAAAAVAGGGRSGSATGEAADEPASSAAAASSSTAGIAGGRGPGGGRGAGDTTAPAAAAAPARAAGLASTGNADAPPLVAIVTPPAIGSGAGGGGAVGAARPAPAPLPAAVGRFAAGAGEPTASAVARGRDDGADDGDEGLSVSLADSDAPLGGGITRRDVGDGLAAPTPVSPARIAASALPAEGRVRDVAEAFARRSPGKRGTDREKTPDEVRAAAVVDRGLDFLARSQQEDGRWALGRFAGSTPADVPKLQSDTAATGLALLCFLGAGHDHFDGPHRDTVRRGLEFLLATQKPDGDLYLPSDDLSNSCAWLYSHGIASIALCEAVGMTGDPRVRPAAEKACGFIAASQHPTRGGWRYTPRSDADLSVSGWMLVAVRSGDLAGLKTDPKTLAGVRTLLEAAASQTDSARYAYNPLKPEQRMSPLSNACMTAVGGLMRLHTGAAADDPRVVRAARALAAVPPEYGSASRKVRDSYLWYYASQVLVHTGGPEWQAWYGRLVATLSATQETAGPLSGSWDPLGAIPDRWGLYGGRIYVTALHLLALEVPDRRLPTYSATKR